MTPNTFSLQKIEYIPWYIGTYWLHGIMDKYCTDRRGGKQILQKENLPSEVAATGPGSVGVAPLVPELHPHPLHTLHLPQVPAQCTVQYNIQ
jgi:hypothetical protein